MHTNCLVFSNSQYGNERDTTSACNHVDEYSRHLVGLENHGQIAIRETSNEQVNQLLFCCYLFLLLLLLNNSSLIHLNYRPKFIDDPANNFKWLSESTIWKPCTPSRTPNLGLQWRWRIETFSSLNFFWYRALRSQHSGKVFWQLNLSHHTAPIF